MSHLSETVNNLSVDDVTKLVALATGLITLATKLGSSVTTIVNNAQNMTSEDKTKLIADIKAAQDAIPEWL